MKRKKGKADVYLVVSIVLLPAAVLLSVWVVRVIQSKTIRAGVPALAPSSPRYVVTGSQPLTFQWFINAPYTEGDSLCWNAEVGWCDIIGEAHLLYRMTDLYTGHLTEIWQADNGVFALTFNQAQAADGQPHPIHQMWIEPLDCLMSGFLQDCSG